MNLQKLTKNNIMITLQKKIFKSFQPLIDEDQESEFDKIILSNILEKVIDLAVKEDRGESIGSNIVAQTNNIIDSFIKK